MSQPTGPLSAFVQGIWSASVCQSGSLVKPLYSDAGSGIIFNLVGNIMIGDVTLPEGVIMLPVKKQAEKMVLPAGAQMAGIRFHPAIGYGVLGAFYDSPTLLQPEKDQRYNLYRIHSTLSLLQDNQARLEALFEWTERKLDFTDVIPNSLEKAIEYIQEESVLGNLVNNVDLSQRQIERMFKLRLGMTPKYYQRVLRIKRAIDFLKKHKNANLSDVAQEFGFSDQSHMTREFQAIAHILPSQISI